MQNRKPLSIERSKFNDAWDFLVRDGRCDDRDGAEYCRVWREYVNSGYPENAYGFILTEANDRQPQAEGE